MPRKVSYGVDFDEEYDAYGDYDDDDYNDNYGNNIDAHEKALESPVTKQEIVQKNVWCCPICTYDNEEYMSSCDICGVLRNPLIRNSNNGQPSTVGGTCTKFGASVMAKSLFTSLPFGTVNLQPQKDASSRKEDKFSLHLHGKIRGQFLDLHNAIISEKHYKVNIVSAPFQFDIPSPDDVVSIGLKSYKIGSKVVPNLERPSTSDATSSKKMENVNLKSNTKSSNKSTPPINSRDKSEHMENNNVSQTNRISSELNSMSMSGESGNSKIPNKGKTGKTASCSQYKPGKCMLLDEGGDKQSQLNLAIPALPPTHSTSATSPMLLATPISSSPSSISNRPSSLYLFCLASSHDYNQIAPQTIRENSDHLKLWWPHRSSTTLLELFGFSNIRSYVQFHCHGTE